ncbi:MAG: chorismate mutase [bacterium]
MNHPDPLDEIRKAIDTLDGSLLGLLNERARLAQEIGRIKERSGCPVYVPGRAEQLMRRLVAQNKGPLDEAAIRAIYREIMSASLALEKDTLIAVEGNVAGLTHFAAKQHFGSSVRYGFYDDAARLFASVALGSADCGVISFGEDGPDAKILELLADESVPGRIFLCAQIILSGEKGNISARYLVLGPSLNAPSGDDQTALLIHLDDQPGALAKALDPFRVEGVNVLSIHSRRSPRGGLHLMLEIEGHVGESLVRKSLETLKSVGMKPMVCGSYPRFH